MVIGLDIRPADRLQMTWAARTDASDLGSTIHRQEPFVHITGISPAEFREIIEKVSQETYFGNLKADIGREFVRRDGTCTRFNGRVVAVESGARASYAKTGRSAPGARKSWQGRRTPAACWHAYRDVLAAVFDVNPSAHVRTAMADYQGRDGFYGTYPLTSHRNVGSMAAPKHMPDLCDCDTWGISTHKYGAC